MVRRAPIPSAPVRSCSAPCRLPPPPPPPLGRAPPHGGLQSPPRHSPHTPQKPPPPPQQNAAPFRKKPALLKNPALGGFQHQSPPQHIVCWYGCKHKFYSLK